MRNTWLAALAATAVLTAGWGLTRTDDAVAVIPEVSGSSTNKGTSWVDRLSDPKRSAAALDDLVRSEDVSTLAEIAESSVDMSARGWAVVGLDRVGGKKSSDVLLRLEQGGEHPMLVRTWAAAARVNRAESLDEVRQLANLQHQFPGLDRPLRMKVESLLGDADLEAMLALSSDGSLAQMVAPKILEMADEAELVALMYTAEEDPIRRQATAFAGTLATQDPDGSTVHDLVIEHLTVPRRLGDVPWEGGALYVPGIPRDKKDSKELIRTLAAWWLLLESEGRTDELNQVWNNLYSYQLLTTAGYDMSLQPQAAGLVERLVQVEGKGNTRELLSSIGLANDKRFSKVLK